MQCIVQMHFFQSLPLIVCERVRPLIKLPVMSVVNNDSREWTTVFIAILQGRFRNLLQMFASYLQITS